jgi:hypothetical protein
MTNLPSWTTAFTPATRQAQRLRPRVYRLSDDARAPRQGSVDHGHDHPSGQTVEGEFISSFRLSKQQWDARKDLNFSFAFRYQPSLVLAPHGAVTDQ